MNKLQAICSLSRNSKSRDISMVDVPVLAAIALLTAEKEWCSNCEIDRMISRINGSTRFARIRSLVESVPHVDDRGKLCLKHRLTADGVKALEKLINFKDLPIDSVRRIGNGEKRK